MQWSEECNTDLLGGTISMLHTYMVDLEPSFQGSNNYL
jgi:hypothetical protein